MATFTPSSRQPLSAAAFQTLTLAQVQSDLVDLYRRIACTQGRVEIAADQGGECDCVLISKAELDALERALNILSDSSAVRRSSTVSSLELNTAIVGLCPPPTLGGRSPCPVLPRPIAPQPRRFVRRTD